MDGEGVGWGVEDEGFHVGWDGGWFFHGHFINLSKA